VTETQTRWNAGASVAAPPLVGATRTLTDACCERSPRAADGTAELSCRVAHQGVRGPGRHRQMHT
jgi:hypothetical protein